MFWKWLKSRSNRFPSLDVLASAVHILKEYEQTSVSDICFDGFLWKTFYQWLLRVERDKLHQSKIQTATLRLSLFWKACKYGSALLIACLPLNFHWLYCIYVCNTLRRENEGGYYIQRSSLHGYQHKYCCICNTLTEGHVHTLYMGARSVGSATNKCSDSSIVKVINRVTTYVLSLLLHSQVLTVFKVTVLGKVLNNWETLASAIVCFLISSTAII